MRSHEERVAETKRRIAKIEREKRLRHNTIVMASAVAACLALLIGVYRHARHCRKHPDQRLFRL